MDWVLVHGTTQSPAGWERLADTLGRRGHRAVTVDLPCDRPGLLADDYARLVAAQVGDTVHEPVVVAHSGGGLLVPALAAALHASRLVWLAAMIPDLAGGASLTDEIKTAGRDMFTAEWRSLTEPPTVDPVVAAYFLFHDCDLATTRWGLSTVRLFYPTAMYAEKLVASRPLPPSTYVLPRDDRTLRPDWMRAAARERLGVEAIEIDAGHCPHVSRPELLASLLTTA
jgi:pimeloyl-ACP methyl ester carboxylesterase